MRAGVCRTEDVALALLPNQNRHLAWRDRRNPAGHNFGFRAEAQEEHAFFDLILKLFARASFVYLASLAVRTKSRNHKGTQIHEGKMPVKTVQENSCGA